MYSVTITWLHQGEETQNVYRVEDYEVTDSLLTLAFDNNHDLVIPLFHVRTVDVQRG
jgi:hypothetical protein